MKVVAVVPMKLNNQRLPQKNTKPLTNGQPLCSYILETLKKVSYLDEIYVYCSDSAIKQFLPCGIKYLERSTALDQNTTKINEVLSAFAADVFADVYVLAHTTAPFIGSESINKGVQAIIEGDYDSAFSVRRIQEFLWSEGKPYNYCLEVIPRTQDLPMLYAETSGFYAYKREIITEFNRRIGNKPFMVEVGSIEGIDIDNEEDFIFADAIYNHYLKGEKEKNG